MRNLVQIAPIAITWILLSGSQVNAQNSYVTIYNNTYATIQMTCQTPDQIGYAADATNTILIAPLSWNSNHSYAGRYFCSFSAPYSTHPHVFQQWYDIYEGYSYDIELFASHFGTHAMFDRPGEGLPLPADAEPTPSPSFPDNNSGGIGVDNNSSGCPLGYSLSASGYCVENNF